MTPVGEATPLAQGTPAVAPVLEVRVAEGKVSVTAREAELGAVLRKIAEAAGIEIEVGPGVEGSVTTMFTDEPLEKAIERVLEVAGAKNFAAQFDMEQATATLRKVVVLRRGEGGEGATVASATGLRDYLDRKYGAGWSVEWDSRERGVAGKYPVAEHANDQEKATRLFERLLDEFAPLLGIDRSQIVLLRTEEQKSGFLFSFSQEYAGVPVEGGGIGGWVNKTIEDGTQRIRVTNYTYHDISISTTPTITAEEAVRVVESSTGPVPQMETYRVFAPALLVYPRAIVPGAARSGTPTNWCGSTNSGNGFTTWTQARE